MNGVKLELRPVDQLHDARFREKNLLINQDTEAFENPEETVQWLEVYS